MARFPGLRSSFFMGGRGGRRQAKKKKKHVKICSLWWWSVLQRKAGRECQGTGVLRVITVLRGHLPEKGVLQQGSSPVGSVGQAEGGKEPSHQRDPNVQSLVYVHCALTVTPQWQLSQPSRIGEVSFGMGAVKVNLRDSVFHAARAQPNSNSPLLTNRCL